MTDNINGRLINTRLNVFRKFLNNSWQIMQPLFDADKTGSLQIDWLQANWEMIVEGAFLVNEFALEPYGDGADCNGASSRVLYPDRLPTHKITVAGSNGGAVYDILNKQTLNTLVEPIFFDRFVSFGPENWYLEKPKFDYILGEYFGTTVVVLWADVEASSKELTLCQ